jgi:hypothetical protein
MTSSSPRLGLILPGDNDVVWDTVPGLNANANTIDAKINAKTGSSFPASGDYDGQWFWIEAVAGRGGLWRWDGATLSWQLARDTNTARGYIAQANNTSAHQIAGGGAGLSAVSLCTIALNPTNAINGNPLNVEVVSQGDILLTGTQTANTMVDVHHYLIPTTGGMTSPIADNTILAYRYQPLSSNNVNQRVPFYLTAQFSISEIASGDHVDHVIMVDRSTFLGTCNIGIDVTTAANGFNKMFYYDYGYDGFS